MDRGTATSEPPSAPVRRQPPSANIESRCSLANYSENFHQQIGHRRQFLRLTAGAAALPAVSRVARAQTYPARPIRLIVGYAAGGTADLFARIMAQSLTERLGQQIIIENRTGGGSNIAAEAVVRAPADGYTLFLVTISNAFNAALYDKLNFKPPLENLWAI
jgi:Tripartite tricarboxylate transporter family receptor